MDRIPPLKYLALFSVWKSGKQSQNCQQIARLNTNLIPLLLRGHKMKLCYFEMLIWYEPTNTEYEIGIFKFPMTKFYKEPRVGLGSMNFTFFLDPYSSNCMIFKFK